MSTPDAKKKGMRTFASDFERVKKSNGGGHTAVHTPPPLPKEKMPAAPPLPKPAAPKPIPAAAPAPGAIPAAPSTSVPKATHSAPNKIPAFHELQKELGDIDLSNKDTKKTARRVSKKNKKGIEPTKAVGGGAIITDTKQSSFSLVGESKKSIFDWFKRRKKKSAPKLAVPAASRRKGVIQEATTKSGTIFTADNDTLKERIKERERQAAMQPDEPETNWSPYTDAGYNLLEAGEPAAATTNVAVEFKQRVVPLPVVDPTPEVMVAPVPAEVVAVPEPVVATPIVPDPVQQPEEIPTADKREVPIEPDPIAPVEKAARESGEVSTNQLTMYILGGILFVLTTGFLSWAIYNALQPSAPTVAPAVPTTSSAAVSATVTIDQSFTIDQLKNYTDAAASSEITLVNSDGEILPTAFVFNTITPALATDIRLYATDIHFFQIADYNSQVVITITDPVSVQGAMLQNEADLPAVFANLYDTEMTGTFVDTTLEGIDVRVLQTSAGSSLTYGIYGDKLIITQSPELFTSVVALVQ